MSMSFLSPTMDKHRDDRLIDNLTCYVFIDVNISQPVNPSIETCAKGPHLEIPELGLVLLRCSLANGLAA